MVDNVEADGGSEKVGGTESVGKVDTDVDTENNGKLEFGSEKEAEAGDVDPDKSNR